MISARGQICGDTGSGSTTSRFAQVSSRKVLPEREGVSPTALASLINS
jgi:hypothetical protein